jgi:hypothetical protein
MGAALASSSEANLSRFDINPRDGHLSAVEIRSGIAQVAMTEAPSSSTKEARWLKVERAQQAADTIVALAKLLPSAVETAEGVKLPEPKAKAGVQPHGRCVAGPNANGTKKVAFAKFEYQGVMPKFTSKNQPGRAVIVTFRGEATSAPCSRDLPFMKVTLPPNHGGPVSTSDRPSVVSVPFRPGASATECATELALTLEQRLDSRHRYAIARNGDKVTITMPLMR